MELQESAELQLSDLRNTGVEKAAAMTLRRCRTAPCTRSLWLAARLLPLSCQWVESNSDKCVPHFKAKSCTNVDGLQVSELRILPTFPHRRWPLRSGPPSGLKADRTAERTAVGVRRLTTLHKFNKNYSYTTVLLGELPARLREDLQRLVVPDLQELRLEE